MRRILDISSDKIALYGNEAPVYLEREGVDVQLGAVLVAEDKQFPISECLVLNGP